MFSDHFVLKLANEAILAICNRDLMQPFGKLSDRLRVLADARSGRCGKEC